MQKFYFICRSVTHAQRTQRVIANAGISAVMKRTPKLMAVEGCSYCVQIAQRNLSEALVAARAAGLPPQRVFTQCDDGRFSEVGI
jgi:hypothetical protein